MNRSKRPGADLQPRWYDRIRQFFADRRPGGRWPRLARRAVAVALVLAAAVVAMSPEAPSEGEPVLALTRDLPVGSTLQASDVAVLRVLRAPDGAARDPTAVTGRSLAGPVRRGEIITDVRLADPAGPDPGPGRVAVPVRPADPAIADLLRPGMHVAVVLVDETGAPEVLAEDAVVLLVPAPAERSTERPVVLAVPGAFADRIVVAALAGSIALRFT